MKIDNSKIKGKKMFIIWKENNKVMNFDSTSDFARYFEVTWKTANEWKKGNIKSDLPFDIYDGEYKNID